MLLRTFIRNFIILVITACASYSYAQAYPKKLITLMVPAAAGSGTDFVARALSVRLAEILGQPVIVENRPGANGRIAMDWMIKQKPDGYTLTLSASSIHAANPRLYKGLRYDPIKDFTPIARLSEVGLVVVVNNSLPVKTFGEFIRYAKTHPDLTYAAPNASSKVSAEWIGEKIGANFNGAYYKVSGQAATDVAAGHVDFYVADFQTILGLVNSKKVRALAVTTAARSPIYPDLPTVSEAFPGFEITAWNGIWGPAGMTPDVVDVLSKTINKILAEPQFQASLIAGGYTAMPLKSPEEFGAFHAQQILEWRRLADLAKINPE